MGPSRGTSSQGWPERQGTGRPLCGLDFHQGVGRIKYGWLLPEARSGAAGSWGLGSIFKFLVVVEHPAVGHLGPESLWGREATANRLNTQASTPSQTCGGQSCSRLCEILAMDLSSHVRWDKDRPLSYKSLRKNFPCTSHEFRQLEISFAREG